MRERAMESHPFRFVQGRLFSQSTRNKDGAPSCGFPLTAKNAMSGEAGRSTNGVLKAEASAQREDAGSKSTRNRAEV
jgi:hypothetical protein